MSVLHYDIGTLQPAKRLANGWVEADAFLTRAGVFEYRNPDGSTRRELRLPEEVFRPDSVATFAGRPFTDDHPPEMLDASNTCTYAKGTVRDTITRDDDHLRGKVTVYDAPTIQKMDAGKLDVSCGYTCDLDETPGTHPLWGAYDAIQRNIVGNHVALVDRGRAGSAAIRMDAAYMIGTEFASSPDRGIVNADMAVAAHPGTRRDSGPAVTGAIDPNDLASRNARGANAAPVKERDADDDHDEDDMDAANCPPGKYGDEDTYDDDGNLTQASRDKMKAASFALPDQEKLPIHDPKHVRAAMSRFGETDFPDADSKHAAFNRIVKRAGDFGVSSTGFEKAHAKNLDRLDRTDTMTVPATNELAQKAARRKTKLIRARVKIDALGKDLATAQGKIESLTTDLERAKADATKARSDGDDKFDAAVDAKVDVVVRAIEVIGRSKADEVSKQARTDSKSVTRALKLAVIKHVDKKDVPATQPEPYIDALFDGACDRARADAVATAGGASALAAARAATTVQPTTPGVAITPVGSAAHADANDDPEETAKRGMRSRTSAASGTPGHITKSDVLPSRTARMTR